MLMRIFETPLIDVLLLLLAIRFIWPQLFRIRVVSKTPGEKPGSKASVHENTATPDSKYTRDQGEYIDYEEIK